MKINKKNALKLWERYYGDARFAEDFHGYLMCRDGYGNPDFFIKETKRFRKGRRLSLLKRMEKQYIVVGISITFFQKIVVEQMQLAI